MITIEVKRQKQEENEQVKKKNVFPKDIIVLDPIKETNQEDLQSKKDVEKTKQMESDEKEIHSTFSKSVNKDSKLI